MLQWMFHFLTGSTDLKNTGGVLGDGKNDHNSISRPNRCDHNWSTLHLEEVLSAPKADLVDMFLDLRRLPSTQCRVSRFLNLVPKRRVSKSLQHHIITIEPFSRYSRFN